MNTIANLSQEEDNLFNPAYCGLILYESIRQYQAKIEGGMPCVLAYLALPMSSSKPIYSCLPHSVTTPISAWVASNEGALVGLASSITAYVDITTRSLGFLLNRGLLVIDTEGNLSTTGTAIAKTPGLVSNNNQLKEAYKSAGLIGRWFSTASSVESVYAQLGVRP